MRILQMEVRNLSLPNHVQRPPETIVTRAVGTYRCIWPPPGPSSEHSSLPDLVAQRNDLALLREALSETVSTVLFVTVHQMLRRKYPRANSSP